MIIYFLIFILGACSSQLLRVYILHLAIHRLKHKNIEEFMHNYNNDLLEQTNHLDTWSKLPTSPIDHYDPDEDTLSQQLLDDFNNEQMLLAIDNI